jgi:hypothetical protein
MFVVDEYPEKHGSAADGSAKEKLIVASDDNFRNIVSSTGFYERHSVQQQGPFEPPRSIAVQVQKFTVLAEKSALRHELLRLSQR